MWLHSAGRLPPPEATQKSLATQKGHSEVNMIPAWASSEVLRPWTPRRCWSCNGSVERRHFHKMRRPNVRLFPQLPCERGGGFRKRPPRGSRHSFAVHPLLGGRCTRPQTQRPLNNFWNMTQHSSRLSSERFRSSLGRYTERVGCPQVPGHLPQGGGVTEMDPRCPERRPSRCTALLPGAPW